MQPSRVAEASMSANRSRPASSRVACVRRRTRTCKVTSRWCDQPTHDAGHFPDAFKSFADQIVPILQAPCLFRRGYQRTTLRKRLSLPQPRPGQPSALPAQTSIRIGVGLKPLQGLFTCGQFDTSTSTSISARTST